MSSAWPYFLIMPILLLVAHGLSRLQLFQVFKKIDATKNFNLQLEGLRGILAVNVFFHHVVISHQYFVTGVWTLPPSRFYSLLGTGSVRLFFFLTGYLFWAKALANKPPPIFEFWKARLKRLAPAYLCSFALILFLVFLQTNFQLKVSASDFLRSCVSWLSVGVMNGFPPINNVDAFHINAMVTWSLSVEVVFYLCLPFLSRLTKPFSFLLFILVCLSIQNGPIKDALTTFGAVGHWTIKLAIWILYGFSFGMIGAYAKKLTHWNRFFQTKKAILILLLGIALLLYLPNDIYDNNWIQSLCLFLFFIPILFGNTVLGLLTLPGSIFLGAISYSVYLIHGIIIFVATSYLLKTSDLLLLSPTGYWLLSAACGVVVLLVCSVIYRIIEFPFLKTSPSYQGSKN